MSPSILCFRAIIPSTSPVADALRCSRGSALSWYSIRRNSLLSKFATRSTTTQHSLFYFVANERVNPTFLHLHATFFYFTATLRWCLVCVRVCVCVTVQSAICLQRNATFLFGHWTSRSSELTLRWHDAVQKLVDSKYRKIRVYMVSVNQRLIPRQRIGFDTA